MNQKPFTQDKYILAIDLGTSGPKVALFSALGEMIGDEFEPIQLILLPNGGAEQDPHEWWQAIRCAMQRLLDHHPVLREDILAICCTSQWAGTVAVDRQGQPLMNAIIWMDSRGAPYIRSVIAGAPEVQGFNFGRLLTWLRLTGGAPGRAGKDPIAHILFIKHELPHIYQETYKFLEPKDYLNLRLTGKFAASFDSIALHWVTDNRDLNRVDYDQKLLEISTIEREKLPDLRRAIDILGNLSPQAADELGLPESVQVVMGTPDLQSAALGSGAVGDFKAHLYVGTSSWLACHVPFKKTDVVHNICSLPSAIPGKYLVCNEQQTTGACLTFLRDQLFFAEDSLGTAPKPHDVYHRFDQLAETAPVGSGGVIFTPWLYGERTPVDDRDLRGGWFNISLSTTRADLIRSVMEGVAFNMRWLLGYAEKFVKQRLDNLHMIGGGAKSDLWCQIHADVLNRTIIQIRKPVQVNAHGVALLASVALGYQSFEQISQRVEIARIYHPQAVHRRIYDELFEEFLGLYQRNKNMYARLNRTS